MKTGLVKSAVCVMAMMVASAAAAGEVDRRQARQQERIDQGVVSGSLTPREAGRMERRVARTEGEIRTDRAMNGGHLTVAEKAKVNREQNRTGRAIYRQKHDGQFVR